MFPLPTPDGRGLIYAANPGSAELSLWWRSLAGGEPRRLTVGVGEYAEPRISNDGRVMIATLYDLRQSLNLLDLTGQTTHLTDGYDGDLDPVMSPQADQLVFTSSRSGNRNLWTANSGGAGARPLTSGSSLDEHPAFSPDGRQIAFISDRGGRRAIWTISADGGTPQKVVDAATVGGMAWLTDGHSLIFAGGSGGSPTLWTATIGASDVKPLLTPGSQAAVQPALCPTRDIVAYFAPPTGNEPGTRIAFVTTAGRALYPQLPPPPIPPGFANGSLAWSDDGRRLAVVSNDTATATSVWIVNPDAADPYQKLVELVPGARIRGITWTRDGEGGHRR